jgi:hypothetical protein
MDKIQDKSDKAAKRFKKVMDGVIDRILLFNPREYEIK